MSVIKVQCIDQTLTIINLPVIASGGILEDYLEFTFCPQWDGYTKTAVFWQDKEHVYYALVNEDNTCTIPKEVIANKGTLFFGVFGVKDDTRRTSEVLRYQILEGVITENLHPTNPTPDIYTQILAEVQRVRNLCAATAEAEEAFENAITSQQTTFETNITNQQNNFESSVNTSITEIQQTADNAVTQATAAGTTAGETAGKAAVATHESKVANASTSAHVTLSDSVTSISSTNDGIAATPNAVKNAYDHASNGIMLANTAQATADVAMPLSGGTFTGNVIAYSTNRVSNSLRNSTVQNSAGRGQSTNYILFRRK